MEAEILLLFTVVNFEPYPKGNVSTAVEEYVVVGCGEAGFTDPSGQQGAWQCGGWIEADETSSVRGVCAPGIMRFLYMAFFPTTLPPGVVFRVGGDTGIHDLVLLVHFHKHGKEISHHNMESKTTRKGMIVRMEPEQESTGVSHPSAYLWLVVSAGSLPPDSVSGFQISHMISEPVVLHPLQICVHTHEFGISVDAWKQEAGQRDRIPLLREAQPNLVQSLGNVTLKQGDVVGARCTYNNTAVHAVSIG